MRIAYRRSIVGSEGGYRVGRRSLYINRYKGNVKSYSRYPTKLVIALLLAIIFAVVLPLGSGMTGCRRIVRSLLVPIFLLLDWAYLLVAIEFSCPSRRSDASLKVSLKKFASR